MADVGWIGVDLDGTLAHDTGWHGPDQIGPPIPEMLERVRSWLREGQRVKIFTARATIPQQIPPIREWLRKNGLPELEVTNVKDFDMIECWDDRAVEVVTNTGRPANPLRRLVQAAMPVRESAP
jgi:hypothetical protein